MRFHAELYIPRWPMLRVLQQARASGDPIRAKLPFSPDARHKKKPPDNRRPFHYSTSNRLFI
jgi:hypothetical protein